MESTRKIGQDKYFLKILTFWSTFVQKSTFGNWTFAQFLSFEWRNGSPKSECTRKIEWDRSILKILTFWSRSRVHLVKAFSSFFFFFFFFNFFAAGSDRARFPGRSNRLVVDDVISYVIALEVSGGWRHRWRHSAGGLGGAWQRVSLRRWTPMLPEARGGAWKLLWSWNFWALLI